MGIDRIGRAGGAAGVTPPISTPAQPASAVTESFEAVAKRVGEASPPSLIDQLKAGQLDMKQFVELRVEQATAHLQGVLDPERLEFIRNALRIQIQSDPALLDLVKAATGALPPMDDRGCSAAGASRMDGIDCGSDARGLLAHGL